MSSKNELLGHWTCEQGGKAEVRQTTKRGRHFYTQCECCGLNQGTGKVRQQKIWDEAQFVTGVTIIRPSNVTDNRREAPVNEPALEHQKPSEPASEPESESLGDFDPTQSEPESEAEAPAEGRSLNKGALLSGLALITAAGVGAWLN
ncbi:hypothetical protein [Marinimicrobium sp. C2-29]|uniref:hypothetical protein n=1 Tax=Marinimicrobium sp. C2-29 TaxID=3139825 RepID=UPI00313A2B0B